MSTDLERLISEIVEEHTSEVIAEAEANYKRAEAVRKVAEENLAKAEREAKLEAEKKAKEAQMALERKQSAERKEYGQAIEAALKLQSETLAEASKKAALTMADAIGQIAKTLGSKSPAPNYRFEIIRDEQGRITEVLATKN